MSVVTIGHVKNASDARAASSSSEGAATPESSSDVRGLLVGLFADETKQSTRNSQLCASDSAAKQRIVEGATWSAFSKEVLKWKKNLIDWRTSS